MEMKNNLSSSKRRLLTRIFAFLSIVYFDIHHSIGAAERSLRSAPSQSQSQNKHDRGHIQIIHNDPQTKDDSIRISFQLHNPQLVPFINIWGTPCQLGGLWDIQGPAGGGVRTGDIPPSLLLGGGLFAKDNDSHRFGGGRVLDFTTTITSNLKILQLGDSISIQIANALDEMLLDANGQLNSRSRLWEAWTGADGGTLVAPTRGGGIHGAWRITALLSKAAQGKPSTKNVPGGGWNYHQVHPFLKHVYSYEGRNVTVEKFDAVVFRVMQGWMKVHEITRERIVEAAEMADSILGAETLVFLTVPFTNNVLDVATHEGVCKINAMIRDVADNWHLTHSDSQMLVMDYGGYSNHVIWANARNMGYDVSNPLTISDSKVFHAEGPNFLLERLNQTVWPPSIPHVCAKKPLKESHGAYCDRNMLFRDGMHFCTETLAARIGAAVACLLGCVYNKKGSSKNDATTSVSFGEGQHNNSSSTLENRMMKMRACEQQCNEQFMSVRPIPESWINSTLASFSDF